MRFSTSPFLPTAYYLLGGHVLLLDYLPRTYCYLLLLGGHVLLVASSTYYSLLTAYYPMPTTYYLLLTTYY